MRPLKLGRIPTLRSYVAFVWAMRSSSFIAPAEAFGIGSSSVWHAVNQLEKKLGVKLFSSGYVEGKIGRQVTPTTEAHELFELVKDQVDHLLKVDSLFPTDLEPSKLPPSEITPVTEEDIYGAV